MKKLLTLLLIFFTLPAFTQVPEPSLLSLKGYGGNGVDQVHSHVTKTDDGGFIIAVSSNSDSNTGNIDSFCNIGGNRVIYLKYNSDASVLEWSKCLADGPYLFPQKDGSFIIGGITSAVPSGWAFKILKEDALGNILWRKTYGGQAASAILSSMMEADDGGYIMAGGCNYTDTDFTIHYGSWMNADIAVVKVDSNGNKVWSKVIGGTGDESVASLIPASNGGCYIVGQTYSDDFDLTGNHGANDAYIVRLDKNGNILWHQDLGGGRG